MEATESGRPESGSLTGRCEAINKSANSYERKTKGEALGCLYLYSALSRLWS